MKLHDVEFDGTNDAVAPPRGERGLKHQRNYILQNDFLVAPPRGERGLKLVLVGSITRMARVAPPRGERGLKLFLFFLLAWGGKSLPLVGSGD